MKRLLIPILLISIFSCTPEKRLARLVSKYPHLVSRDTIIKDTTIYIPSKEISGEIELNVNSKIDSLLNLIGKDTLSNRNIINEIHKSYVNYPIIRDTIKIDTAGIRFTLYQSGGKLLYNVFVHKDSANLKYPSIINNVNPVKEVHVIKWWDWASYVISILALLFIAFDIWASKRK